MSAVTTWTVVEPFLPLKGELLEGPTFIPHLNQLSWVDIARDEVYFLDLEKGPASLRIFSVPGDTIATIANNTSAADEYLVGAKYGFATFDAKSGEISYYRKYFDGNEDTVDPRRFRANDGAVDAKGRILQGIMIDDKIEPTTSEGMLVCLDLDGRMHRLAEGVVCPNGLGWNSTNSTMYWAESFSGNVYTFDYDVDTGHVLNQRVFFHLDGHDNVNVPDGLVVDEEEHVWLAVWGGSAVLRISPQGQVVGRVEMPTRFVTCPVFVGSELFITTAAERDPVAYAQSALRGGQLYKIDVGVRGLPKFSGSR